jgi:hypothetical protein
MINHPLDIVIGTRVIPTPRRVQTIHNLDIHIQHHLLNRNLPRNLHRMHIQQLQPLSILGQLFRQHWRRGILPRHSNDLLRCLRLRLLRLDAVDEGLRVCGWEGLAEVCHGPFFDGGEDGVHGGAGVKVVHPGFKGI